MTQAQSRARGRAWRLTVRPIARFVTALTAVLFFFVCVPIALVARLAPKRVDIGLGPEPLVNNLYHKRALELAGYTAETFVDQVWYITSDFDYRGDLRFPGPSAFLRGYMLFVRAVFRYRCLYIYFNGGPLMSRPLVWRMEPFLYRIAGVRVVAMPYGGDVQEMSRSKNLSFKHAMSTDYPGYRKRRLRIADQVDLWTSRADHVISGVEWVDYMYHWDTLMLGHFSIDTELWQGKIREQPPGTPLRILHAPNHQAIKGTRHFVSAVQELQSEGVGVQLVTLERVSNEEIRRAMSECDVVADQLVVGWYAMFALEAMSMGKPVLCFLRQDLIELYEREGLVSQGEIPIVNCDPLTVKESIRALAEDRQTLREIGARGPGYVRDHHSLEYVGSVFDCINRSLGVMPSRRTERV